MASFSSNRFRLSVLFVTLLIILWYRSNRTTRSANPPIAIQTRAENVIPVQLTTAEKLYILGVADSSPAVINYHKYLQHVASHIEKPAESIPYGSRPVLPGTQKPGETIEKIFNGRRNGFFVECGAYDGQGSQTQFLESKWNWTGLLIEANQKLFKELLKLNRKAYVFGGCLTPRHPKQIQFSAGDVFGFSEELKTEYFHNMLRTFVQKGDGDYLVQCFPLTHLLASIGINHVNVFSLDIQGGEHKILEAIDYNTLRIDVIMVEVEHSDTKEKEILRNKMREFFNKTGLYDEAATLDNDMVFQRKDVHTTSIAP